MTRPGTAVALAAMVLALTLSVHAAAPAAGQAACRQPGATTPVLLVHGLGGSESVFDQGNLRIKDSVGAIAGTFVDTFDYSRVNRKWVTDPGIGQALAERISCLGAASEAAGGTGKVLVVAHSMGGLAVRQAGSLSVDGRPVADRLGLVVTLGTPHDGSWLEGAVTGGTTGPVSAVAFKALTRALRLQCELAAPPLALAGVCQLVEDPTSDAALAMRPGSPELAALPKLREDIPVLAVAGQIRLLTLLFGETRMFRYDIGDILVLASSANQFGSNPIEGGGSLVQDCDMYVVELVDRPGWTGCSHGGLLSELNVATAVNKAVRTWLSTHSPVRLAADGLRTAPFGTDMEKAIAALTTSLGPPDYAGTWHDRYCATGEGGGGRLMVWGRLSVLFNDGGLPVGNDYSQRQFVGQRVLWGYEYYDRAYDQGAGREVAVSDRAPLKTPSGAGIGTTGRQLEQIYGAQAKSRPGDPNGFPPPGYVVTVPSGEMLYFTMDANGPQGSVTAISAGRGCGE